MTESETSKQPELPYAGTSGWAGSESSESRARNQDADGTTTQRQALALRTLERHRSAGMTFKELGDALEWHHGQSSGVLSVLHKTGKIERLTLRRNRCKIYVLPEFVANRTVEPHGETSTTVLLRDMAEYLFLPAQFDPWARALVERYEARS